VIAVVQPNAQNLVRSGDRRADSLARESGELTGRRALGYQGLNPIESSSAEKRLVEVRNRIGQVDVALFVDSSDGFFGAERTDAHQVHR
jgi:hypothetical protein